MNALFELLLSVADDKLALGSRNSDWTGLAPILEEDIAFSSMAQDDIGHAAALYQFLAEQDKTRSADQIAYGRLLAEYRCAALVEIADDFNWAVALTRLFLFAQFDLLRLQRLSESSDAGLAALGARMSAEKRIHTEHCDSWMVRLSRGSADAQQRLQDALDRLTPLAVTLFEPTAGVRELETAGVYPARRNMYDQWHEIIRRVTNEASLRLTIQPLSAEYVGGRRGTHTPAFAELLHEMTEVYRAEPNAAW